MKTDTLYITNDVAAVIAGQIESAAPDRTFIITDTNCRLHCLPLAPVPEAEVITVEAGDENKNLTSLTQIWQTLSQKGCSRKSLIICLGGGMTTDMGGFAAATFKRGVRHINVPTTLLAMVDAATGGKTGINFCGLKNEIGAFAPAESVIIDTRFLKTTSHEDMLSGYGEMLKHGLISDRQHWREVTGYDISVPDYEALLPLVKRSVEVKRDIVRQDPTEQGIRKMLNFGHTIGHAFESMAMMQHRPVPHGYAVAWGIVCELYLSVMKTAFPTDLLHSAVYFIKDHYGTFVFDCSHYDTLLELMTHDKKNSGGMINFTLLADIGQCRTGMTADKKEICEALDFFRECMGN